MARRFVRLPAAGPEDWDPHGRDCLFWQLPAGRSVSAAEAPGLKESWVHHVAEEWGPCGFLARVDGRTVGHVVYAPVGLLPGAQGLPTPPADPATVLLAGVYVAPDARGNGCGKALVQQAARDLVQRRVSVLEVIAGRGAAGAGCVPDEAYVTRLGFVVQRDHPVHPRLRMDLRTTLRVRGELGTAWGRLVGAVRPAHQPAPEAPSSGRTSRQPVTLPISSASAAFGLAPTMEFTTSPPE